MKSQSLLNIKGRESKGQGMVVSALLSLTFPCSSSSFHGGIDTRCMLEMLEAQAWLSMLR
jgi:hypothetical protein